MARSTVIDSAIAQLEQQVDVLNAQIQAKREAIVALRAAQQKTPRRKPTKSADGAPQEKRTA